MAATNIDLLAYSDALLVLGTAGVIVPAVHRWRVNPVLAFLVAGAVLGPLGLGSFKEIWPNLQWVTITDAKNVASIAELGVVFLLFLIGLELSYERLLTMRRLVFGLGSLQVVLSAAVISAIAALLGSKGPAAVIIGLSLALSSTAIVIGHGRVGQIVCAMLERHKYPFISTDRDPAAVSEWRRRGREVYYGDAAKPAFLKSCGLLEAPAVIVTIHDQDAIDEIVHVARSLRPDILIVSRARDATHARHLYAIGVTDAVPETIEASLQLSEAALVGLGLPTGAVIASIHEKRDEVRHDLQEAAGQAGQAAMHSIRAKTLRGSSR